MPKARTTSCATTRAMSKGSATCAATCTSPTGRPSTTRRTTWKGTGTRSIRATPPPARTTGCTLKAGTTPSSGTAPIPTREGIHAPWGRRTAGHRRCTPSRTDSTSRHATTTRRRSGGTTSRNKAARKSSSPTGRGRPPAQGRTPSPYSRTARCTSPSWQARARTSTSAASCNPSTTG